MRLRRSPVCFTGPSQVSGLEMNGACKYTKRLASSRVLNLTKPKPLEVPLLRSRITVTSCGGGARRASTMLARAVTSVRIMSAFTSASSPSRMTSRDGCVVTGRRSLHRIILRLLRSSIDERDDGGVEEEVSCMDKTGDGDRLRSSESECPHA